METSIRISILKHFVSVIIENAQLIIVFIGR